MPPHLQVTYCPSPSAFLAPRLSVDSSMSSSTTSVALTPRSSVSSTGTNQVPSLALSATSSSDALSPPVSPSELPAVKRPGLKHMPSWRSFVSFRSRSTSSDIPLAEEGNGEAEADDDDDDRFGDAEEADRASTVGSLKVRIKGVSQSVRVMSSRKGRPSSIKSIFGHRPGSRGKLSTSTLASPAHVRPSRIEIPSAARPLVTALALDSRRPRDNRVDTPLSMPLPLIATLPSASHLDVLVENAGGEDVDPVSESDHEEYFTPRQYPTPTPPSHYSHTLPTRLPLRSRPRIPQRSAQRRPAPVRRDDRPPPSFNLDIFSPRLSGPPPTPVLRGLLNQHLPNDPISPLDLPSPGTDGVCATSSIFGVLASSVSAPSLSYPTPVLPRNAFACPNSENSGFASATPVIYSPRSLRSRTTRLGSITHHSPTCPAQATPRTSMALGRYHHPRRHSSISIRPAILPCPTPPSLLASPRQLGTPLLSPNGMKVCGCASTLSPASATALAGAGAGAGGVARRGSRRGSRVSALGTFGGGIEEWRAGGEDMGLGLGWWAPRTQAAEEGAGLVQRLENLGMNPYFAGAVEP